MSAAEQRWILELADVLALRLECNRCGASVVLKPTEWRDPPMECPGCRNHWELPTPTAHGFTPMQHFGLGLRHLLEQTQSAVKQGGMTPYRVCMEIKDPASSDWAR